MNATKKINVNFSSLVGLKAELLRKQTEVNEARLKAETARGVPKIKKKNKRPKENITDDRSEQLLDVDDINAHKKSKLMLEAKAKLYDRLKRSKNKNENFLVDFTSKSDNSEEEILQEREEHESAVLDNEDDWVEYQDCFGRTRKCLREDLPVMQEKDDLVKQQVMNRKSNETRHKDIIEEKPVIEEKEPEIEIMRRKWEEQTEKLADKVNIHYQDILFDEARAHGVGYYAFSQDEEERIKQQENLANLRKDTERKQKEMKDLKELRDRMEQNRLKAARIRQRIRAGLPAEPTEDELQTNNDTYNLDTKESVPIVTTAQENTTSGNKEKDDTVKENIHVEDQEVIKEDKIKALGDLLGKKTVWHEMSQEEWVYKCRNMRVKEFGPIYDSFKSAGYLIPENKNSKLLSDKDIKETPSAEDSADTYVTSDVDKTFVGNQNVKDHTNVENMSQSNYLQSNSGVSSMNISNNPTQVPLSQNFDSYEAHGTSSLPNNTSFEAYLQEYKSYSANTYGTDNIEPNVESTQMFSDISQNSALNRSINEENIVAGLRYLREKFEKGQNT